MVQHKNESQMLFLLLLFNLDVTKIKYSILFAIINLFEYIAQFYFIYNFDVGIINPNELRMFI